MSMSNASPMVAVLVGERNSPALSPREFSECRGRIQASGIRQPAEAAGL
jgi:hypothetical protein